MSGGAHRLTEKLDGVVESIMRAARIPGAAIAMMAGDEVIIARGYGCRNAGLPMTSATVYPIASTTKAINATLLGLLVDDGHIAWDAPVQRYLPSFRLQDPLASAQVTLRDLLTMRTGLPRHDWVWIENPMSRAELVERLRYLELSAGFRERFQYNNMTSTTAGHIAEVVTGRQWNELVQERLLDPLGMKSTTFALPATDNVSASYHENQYRQLLSSARLASEVTAPSGGAMHSTVEDMSAWLRFNLNGGRIGGLSLIKPQTLAEIYSPQIIAALDQGAPTPNAAYALGWFVDTYHGHARLSHGGYIHDIGSEVMVFPEDGVGIVSFTNFGAPGASGSSISVHSTC